MSFYFEDLDNEIRKAMEEELDHDLADNSVYYSKNFSESGKKAYLPLLRKAMQEGTEETLAEDLKKNLCFNVFTLSKTKSGKITTKRVSSDAHINFAGGEFNRYYMRALCKIAEKSGKNLIICRLKESKNPRPESESKLGEIVNPKELLEDLRKNKGIETNLKIPTGPNSGISVKLKK